MSEDSEKEDYSDGTISDEDESVCFSRLYSYLISNKTCVINSQEKNTINSTGCRNQLDV